MSHKLAFQNNSESSKGGRFVRVRGKGENSHEIGRDTY